MSKSAYCIPCQSYRHGGRSKSCKCLCHGREAVGAAPKPNPVVMLARGIAAAGSLTKV
jgi:hypothetical protein